MHSNMILLAQAMPEGRVFGLDSQTLISIGIQLANGIILAIALSIILYKPVKEFMRKRTEGIQSKIEEADATMAKANEIITQYEAMIKNIDQERIDILEAARSEATDESKMIIERAKTEANEIRKLSQDSILEDKKRLQAEARLYIIELASIMAQKYITHHIDSETQDKIYEETLAGLEEAKW